MLLSYNDTIIHTRICILHNPVYHVLSLSRTDETFVFDPAACTSGFNTSCNAQGVCKYKATWTVRGDFVDFTVSAQVEEAQWVGIGFSEDTLMVRLTAIICCTLQ